MQRSGVSTCALIAALLLGGCSFFNAPAAPAPEPAPPPVPETLSNTGRAEILWDTYGVPHVVAQDPGGLFYAFGWAQMRNHADLILQLYGQARGRAAEYWGERYVESDVWVRTNSIPGRAAQWVDRQPAHARAYLDAFVAGMNAWAIQHADSIGAEFRQVLPIEAADVLAHQQRVLNFTFVANPAMATGAQRMLAAPGSNAWAIGPARTDARTTMLLANPHLPWGDLFTFFEAQLTSPEIDAYGATLVGMPFLAIAFNERLGWTHTVNTIDGADLYALQTNGDYYLYDGAMQPLHVEEQAVRVRQPDGSLVERSLRVRSSVHGPIIAERDGRAIALRVAGLDAHDLLTQYWDMGRARTLAEFDAALSRLQLPMFTVMYADRDGNIMHVFNGHVPARPHGDWSYWQGVVPGDSSSTLWTYTHSYIGLPRVVNPPSGWLQNANDPPWTTTLPLPLDPRFFPAYMAPPPSMQFRAQQSARMLERDSRITYEELLQYKHSTRMSAADHFLLDLIAAARQSADADARAGAEVLEAWDRNADAGSRGAVLFLELMRALQRHRWPGGSPYEVRWMVNAPLATPDGLADPQQAVQLLAQTVRNVRSRFGALEVAWGDVFRLRRDSLDLPANGGPGSAGVFRVTDFEPQPGDSTRFVASSGDSFVFAVEFTAPLRARALLTYGNASQTGSPHRTDQLPLYARKELRPVWFTRDDIMQNLRDREAF